MSRSYYEILKVSKDANEAQVKKAYHALARTLHPDKAKDDNERKRLEEEFAQVTTAYNTLKDPAARAQYDESSSRSTSSGSGSSASSPSAPSSTASGVKNPTNPGGAVNSQELEKGRKAVAQRAFAQGVKLLQLKEYDRAAEFLRAAIKSDDSVAQYHDRLAVTLLRSRKGFSDAVTAAKRASELDPYKVEFKMHLAELYEAIGSKAQAESVYEDILKWDPDNSIAKAALEKKLKAGKEGPLKKLWRSFVGRKG